MPPSHRWALDGSALDSNRGGDETYLRTILEGLHTTRLPDEEVVVVRRGPVRSGAPFGFASAVVDARSGASFYGHGLGKALRRLRPDAALSMTHAPLMADTPVSLAVLDLSFEHLPTAYPPATRARLRWIVRRQVRIAATVVTISNFSKRDIVDTYDVDPQRVFVVPGAVAALLELTAEQWEQTRSWRARLGVRGRYVLYLGNLHPRKNVATAIRAFAGAHLDDAQLVVAGARWWGDDEQSALSGVEPGRVVLTGRVDDVQREVLLQDAACLVYPSLFEGFGLPPIEAMQRGVPVVASNATALPETVGDAALLVGPLDVAAMSAALEDAFHCGATRTRLISAGPKHAARFSPARTGMALRESLLEAQRIGADRSPEARPS